MMYTLALSVWMLLPTTDALPLTVSDSPLSANSPAIPRKSTNFSFSPNVSMAKVFSHSGVRSMLACPTATSGVAGGR